MKIQIDTFLIKLQYLVLIGIVLTQVFAMDAITSLLFTGTFFLTASIWLMKARKGVDGTSILGLVIIGLSFVGVMVNALLTNAPLSFSYLKKMIMFWSTILLLDAFRNCIPEMKLVLFILRINTVLCVIFIAAYYGLQNQMHYFYGRVSNYLTFHFDNPNLTGVLLTGICMLQVLSVCLAKSAMEKLTHFGLVCYLVSFIFGTRSRNSILVICLFFVILFFLRVFYRVRSIITAKTALVVSMAPILFAAVYMLVVNTAWIQNTFGFFAGTGKELDSRAVLWNYALETIFRFPVFGAYYQLAYESVAPHMHNTHLDIAASYGIPVLCLVCAFLYRILQDFGKNCKHRINVLSQVAFIGVLLTGLGESMLFAGGLGTYIYAGLFLLFVHCDFGDIER